MKNHNIFIIITFDGDDQVVDFKDKLVFYKVLKEWPVLYYNITYDIKSNMRIDT